MKKSIIKLLTNTVLITIIVFTSTLIQTYWSMGKFTDHTSSGCLGCSFLYDVFFISLCSTIVLTILFLLIARIKKNRYKITLQFLLLTVIWHFWNYTIFVDRASSWSTYSVNEEIFITIYLSFLPILVLSTLTLLTINHQIIFSKFSVQKKQPSTSL
jgi:hypothetical protein